MSLQESTRLSVTFVLAPFALRSLETWFPWIQNRRTAPDGPLSGRDKKCPDPYWTRATHRLELALTETIQQVPGVCLNLLRLRLGIQNAGKSFTPPNQSASDKLRLPF